ncbi:hypothetical protein AGR9A_Cc210231 [Agrobacterium salinitolerans str. Hayward 0363]|nr:hypothetical protein AGR9A_Cc210231 [Agrobacterium salinitolerans str. Hayward 0363]
MIHPIHLKSIDNHVDGDEWELSTADDGLSEAE